VAYVLHFSAVSILTGPNPFRREHKTLSNRTRGPGGYRIKHAVIIAQSERIARHDLCHSIQRKRNRVEPERAE
jgi:hypothetical protein